MQKQSNIHFLISRRQYCKSNHSLGSLLKSSSSFNSFNQIYEQTISKFFNDTISSRSHSSDLRDKKSCFTQSNSDEIIGRESLVNVESESSTHSILEESEQNNVSSSDKSQFSYSNNSSRSTANFSQEDREFNGFCLNFPRESVQPKSCIALVYSPDGQEFASSHGDHIVRIWQITDFKCRLEMRDHARTPQCLKYHPRIKNIITSGCLGGNVFVWNTQSGEHLIALKLNTEIYDFCQYTNKTNPKHEDLLICGHMNGIIRVSNCISSNGKSSRQDKTLFQHYDIQYSNNNFGDNRAEEEPSITLHEISVGCESVHFMHYVDNDPSIPLCTRHFDFLNNFGASKFFNDIGCSSHNISNLNKRKARVNNVNFRNIYMEQKLNSNTLPLRSRENNIPSYVINTLQPQIFNGINIASRVFSFGQYRLPNNTQTLNNQLINPPPPPPRFLPQPNNQNQNINCLYSEFENQLEERLFVFSSHKRIPNSRLCMHMNVSLKFGQLNQQNNQFIELDRLTNLTIFAPSSVALSPCGHFMAIHFCNSMMKGLIFVRLRPDRVRQALANHKQQCSNSASTTGIEFMYQNTNRSSEYFCSSENSRSSNSQLSKSHVIEIIGVYDQSQTMYSDPASISFSPCMRYLLLGYSISRKDIERQQAFNQHRLASGVQLHSTSLELFASNYLIQKVYRIDQMKNIVELQCSDRKSGSNNVRFMPRLSGVVGLLHSITAGPVVGQIFEGLNSEMRYPDINDTRETNKRRRRRACASSLRPPSENRISGDCRTSNMKQISPTQFYRNTTLDTDRWL